MKITVGPYEYVVSFDGAAMHKANKDAMQLRAGQIHYTRGDILIEPEQSPSRQRETVMHEVLHGVLDYSALDRVLKDEEEFIHRFAPVLLDTLRRNPDLLAFLLAVDE